MNIKIFLLESSVNKTLPVLLAKPNAQKTKAWYVSLTVCSKIDNHETMKLVFPLTVTVTITSFVTSWSGLLLEVF